MSKVTEKDVIETMKASTEDDHGLNKLENLVAQGYELTDLEAHLMSVLQDIRG